jgi:hypothetical protein
MRPACIICGSRKVVENNHAGDRRHVAWFTPPFCKIHHDHFHELLRNIGVDLRYTPNELERLNRASQAIMLRLSANDRQCHWEQSETPACSIPKFRHLVRPENCWWQTNMKEESVERSACEG